MRSVLGSLVGAATLLIATAAFAQRVVLVRPSGTDAVLAEAFNRLRAELLLQDFEVLVVEADAGASSPDSVALAAQRAAAFAGISLTRRAGTRSADVWLADRVTGKTTLRTLALEQEGDAPSVLAVRAVDLLRSSLREYAPGEAPPPEVSGVDRRPIPKEIRTWSALPRAAFALELKGVALVQASELGAAYGPGAALEYRVSDRFRVGLAFSGPLLGASFESQSGTASVRQELGALEGTFIALRVDRFELGVVAGAGVYHMAARAEVDPPLVAQSDQVTSALFSAGIRSELRFSESVGANAELAALGLAPRPGVAVDQERVLFRLPLVEAAVGLTVEF